MAQTYIATVETDDIQNAVCAVMDDNISEDIAQGILDNYIEPSAILSPVGSSASEESDCIQKALQEQITQQKDEISMYIDEMLDDQ